MRIISLSPGDRVELEGPQFWDAVSVGAWLAGPAPRRRERWETTNEQTLFRATLASAMEDAFHRAAVMALLGYERAPQAPVTSPHVILVMGGRLALHTVKPEIAYIGLKCLNWNAASRPGIIAHGQSWGSRFEITSVSMGETILRGARDPLVCVMVDAQPEAAASESGDGDDRRPERRVVVGGDDKDPGGVQSADLVPANRGLPDAGMVDADVQPASPQAPLAPTYQGADAFAWLDQFT